MITSGIASGRQMKARATGIEIYGTIFGCCEAMRSRKRIAAVHATTGPCCQRARVAVEKIGEQNAKMNAAARAISALRVLSAAITKIRAVAPAHQNAVVIASSSALTRDIDNACAKSGKIICVAATNGNAKSDGPIGYM